MTLTVGSLFAGIGGFDLGLERAGMSVRWQVENNPWCQRVLAKHWPDVTRYGDIKQVDWHTVEPVDLVCGGFPCQDISFAGKGAGLTGERSSLWFEYAKAIEVLTPRYVIIENVAALRSRGLDQVLGSLAALGYDAEWHCIPASAIGAPHRRDRVWIVAYRPIDGLQEREWQDGQPNERSVESGGVDVTRGGSDVAHAGGTESGRVSSSEREKVSTIGSGGEDVADTERERSQRRGDGRAVTGSSGLCGGAGTDENESIRRAGIGWLPEPGVGVGNDGLSPRLDGGGLDGQTEEGRPDQALCELRQPTATENDERALGGHGGVPTSEVLQPGLYGPRLCQRCAITYGHVSLAGKEAPWDSLRIVWGYEAVAHSSHRRERAKQLSRQHPNLMRQLSQFPPPPCPACWADGSWEAGLPRVAHKIPHRVDRLRGLGNAVVPQIVEWLGRCIINAQEAQHDESRLSQTGTVLQ